MKEAADTSEISALGGREDESAIDGRQAQAIAQETAASPGKGQLGVKGRQGWKARLPRASAAHQRCKRRARKAEAQKPEDIDELGVRDIVHRLIRSAVALQGTSHAQPNFRQ
ncbi:hypothetical protein [Methylobacterium oxalidis]|uniref:hypothetical protein n=1 Tax=Methylobacterium oxalidis TaxID=944322 RepID=UPI003314C212